VLLPSSAHRDEQSGTNIDVSPRQIGIVVINRHRTQRCVHQIGNCQCRLSTAFKALTSSSLIVNNVVNIADPPNSHRQYRQIVERTSTNRLLLSSYQASSSKRSFLRSTRTSSTLGPSLSKEHLRTTNGANTCSLCARSAAHNQHEMRNHWARSRNRNHYTRLSYPSNSLPNVQ